jgi:hypothetical protein
MIVYHAEVPYQFDILAGDEEPGGVGPAINCSYRPRELRCQHLAPLIGLPVATATRMVGWLLNKRRLCRDLACVRTTCHAMEGHKACCGASARECYA